MSDAAIPVGGEPDVVGREAEQARVDAFLAAMAEGPRVLAIRGEPGIGKSALWRAALGRGREAGYHLLVTRPAEEEMSLALGGLVDLFEHTELDAEALLEDDDPLVRGRLVLDALRHLSAERPTLVAVDDLQWLDSASARALRFALRRLETEPIGILATARAAAEPDRLGTSLVVPRDHFETLVVGPLSLSALREILARTAGSLTRPTLRRIHETSGGNPLYAIELARALAADTGREHTVGDLPLPGSLQSAIARRLETVPPELDVLLETVSAIGPTSVGEVSETLPDCEVETLVETAEHLGLLIVEDDLRVRFAHPLLASAVYGRMNPLARHARHAHLAGRARSPDVRARHLALSTDKPDAAVAAQLEEAGGRASRRAAFDQAAAFAHHSLRLTPSTDDDAAARRAIAEIANLTAAGEVSRALTLADRLVASLPPGPRRAEAILVRIFVEDDDTATNERRLVQALEDAGVNELLRAQVLDVLGWRYGMFRGDLASGIACAEEAAAVAERLGDPELEMRTTTGLGAQQALAGRPQPARLARAIELADEIGLPPQWAGPRVWQARQLLWNGDLAGARAAFERIRDEAVRTENEFRRPHTLYDLALVECAAGDFDAAARLVQEGVEAAHDAEDPYTEGWLLYPLALVETWLGRVTDARTTAGQLLDRNTTRGQRPGVARARSVLGLLALAENDAESAVRELGEAAQLLQEMGVGHPGAIPVLPDAIEALARAGDGASAGALLERLERQAAAVQSGWALAATERCRGVLLLADGEADAAVMPLEHAEAAFDASGHHPDAVRAMLTRGRSLLRAGQRTAAAEVLAEARERFAAMGAALWEARAAEELTRASPGRAGGLLTDVEGRVAALVAEGRKNREIGQTLFMSVATVEAHLTRIYRKLGIRSRAELARLVAEGRLVGARRSIDN